ncbi:MAG: acyltransferase [Armatimonadetes bacterium]|nr:acyltransferase [Armatimonadota bacterium]
MELSRKRRNPVWLRLLDKTGHVFFSLLYRINSRLYMRWYPSFLRLLGVHISGNPVYIATSAFLDSSDYGLININDKCVITGEVMILTHDYSVSRVAVAKGIPLETEFRMMRPVAIGENSFIGTRSIIMPGVSIGRNAIVGAGSVVTKDVDDNTVVVGNPARAIGTIDMLWEKVQENAEVLFFE